MLQKQSVLTANPDDRISDLFAMYQKMYNMFPDEHVTELELDDDHIVDISKIKGMVDNGDLPYSIYSMCSVRRNKEKTSCAGDNEIDDDDVIILNATEKYIRHYSYNGPEHTVIPQITLHDIQNKIFFVIYTEYIVSLYDSATIDNIEEIVDELFKQLPQCVVEIPSDRPSVSLVAFDPKNGDYYTVLTEINKVDIDIEKNYNDDFKPICDDIFEFLCSEERKSGLIILNGEPGTGKTYFIRHLVNCCPKDYIIIPPSIAPRLSSPEFIDFMLNHEDCIFILEDCETVIRSRSSNDFTNAVSSILNMSDGLMSDIMNVKIICTFNADINTIDEAILRKGRCFANYEFKKLDKEKVKVMLNERGIELDEYEDMTLADIYNYDCKNIDQSKKKKIGF